MKLHSFFRSVFMGRKAFKLGQSTHFRSTYPNLHFLYDGKPFHAIEERAYLTIAYDLKQKCLTAMQPLMQEIVQSNGQVYFEFKAGFKSASVRMTDIDGDLQKRIVQAIPALRTL